MAPTKCDLGVATRGLHNGRILLVKEASGRHKGCWGLPKGRVEPNESPEEAALRELHEETGFTGIIGGLVGVRTALHGNYPAVFLCFDVRLGTQTGDHDDEISEIGWFSLRELNGLRWVSETMHQLALDAFTQPVVLPAQAGLTPRTSAYAVYRSSRTSPSKGAR